MKQETSITGNISNTQEIAKNAKKNFEPPKKIKCTGLPWFDEPHSPVFGESSLWLAVITQALMDALGKANDSESRYQKDEAIRWLTGNSKDFIDVCLYAGVDPDYVRKKAKKSLVSPVSWRAAPGKGKRYHERKAKRKAMPNKLSSTEKNEQLLACTVISGPWKNRNELILG